ncbi:hypothetical protein Taro_018122 [Colocasia esculenta]|uniref:Bifunctional inhibitor/plant lipid transfer protein/seed storage helical domain-containing protein n=1 Tax=Colocasia esculenta TaxID=4460 RepID=A0A843UVA7_COLES|nr:hypothetical protein [Colocasia esculenta]
MAAGILKLLASLLLPVLVRMAASPAGAAVEMDEMACADQLESLASCIPFVSGSAPRPTPACCQDTRRVRSSRPECLCLLIKDSADPAMGLPINTTLALRMPAACKIDARVSDCPAILKLPPGSPEAKIFSEAGAGQAPANPSSPASVSGSTSSGSSPTATPGRSKGDGGFPCPVSWWRVGLLVPVAWDLLL